MKPDDEVDDGDSMAAYGEGDTGKQTFNHIGCDFKIVLFKTRNKNHHHNQRKLV